MAENNDLFPEDEDRDPQAEEKSEDQSSDQEPASSEDEEIIELVDAADEDLVELTDEIDTGQAEAEEEIIDLTDIADTGQAEAEEEIIDLTDIADTGQAEVEDDIVELTDTVDDSEPESLEEIAEPAEESDSGQEEVEEDIVGLTEESDKDIAPADKEIGVAMEEDKELIALIDDIQSTLNGEKATPTDETAVSASDEETIDIENSIDTEAIDEDELMGPYMLGDDEYVETELSESESEFVDHLGIDLTSEVAKSALDEAEEATIEDVKAVEELRSTPMETGQLEETVKKTIANMLADEDSPISKAIDAAVKKELDKRAGS
jgi:hypothetical protein